MIRAVFEDGAIRPLDPLPSEWREGDRLVVEQAEAASPSDDLERWAQRVTEAAAGIPPEDFQLVDSALADADRLAKDLVRRDMGLGA